MDKKAQVPAVICIHDCQITGPVRVTFEGSPVGTRLWDRIKTAFFVLTGRAHRLYSARTSISGCTITNPKPGVPALAVGE